MKEQITGGLSFTKYHTDILNWYMLLEIQRLT